MRRLIVLVAAVISFAAIAFAQAGPDAPKGEFFFGYNVQHSNLSNESLGTTNLNGANAQATVFMRKNLGITADVSYAFGDNVLQSGENARRLTYLFGPTYALHTESSVTPFIHALFGLDHERISIPNFTDFTDNSFAFALGGGFDYALAQHVALRPVQLDYIRTDHASSGQNNFRYSVGLTFKF
jgi:opacity protein-like surface antigen